MAYPVAPVVMPADLAGKSNGQLPPSLLADVVGGGKLHHLCARAWRALVADAWASVQLPLTYTYGGTYRSYAQQETLFRSRYSPSGTGGGCKTWNGVRWCKKSSNLATAAVPGTSNHGWGLAVDSAWDKDLSDGLGPDDATAITSHPGWQWLLANAERYGFSWELQSEPWHLRYVAGDSVPQAVLDFEGPTTPQPTTQENDMVRIDIDPDTPRWVSMVIGATTITHTVNGHHAAVLERAKVAQEDVNKTELLGILLSLRATNDSPFAPGMASADAELHAAWEAAKLKAA
jgi:hypothetical protein